LFPFVSGPFRRRTFDFPKKKKKDEYFESQIFVFANTLLSSLLVFVHIRRRTFVSSTFLPSIFAESLQVPEFGYSIRAMAFPQRGPPFMQQHNTANYYPNYPQPQQGMYHQQGFPQPFAPYAPAVSNASPVVPRMPRK
jgi:hypothetical protein